MVKPDEERAARRLGVMTDSLTMFKTHAYQSEERDYVDSILDLYLKKSGLSHLQNKLSYCVHELGNNAKKANLKRVYFKAMNLDMESPASYHIGMANFMQETTGNIDYYLNLLREDNLHVKFQFQGFDKAVFIMVRNNIKLLDIEKHRIYEKIRSARSCRNMAEAYGSIMDASEGAGLGLVMLILMLRNIGLPDDVLQFIPRTNETLFLLKIPRL